ncbi:MAG: hypothetical protein ABI619_08020 [Betaproteobacteria bacterium]
MKALFFVLLAANLAMAGFYYVREHLPNPDAQLIRQQVNADQIRIVPARPVPPPAPIAATSSSGTCLEWGSFGVAELPKAQSAIDALALGDQPLKTDVAVTTSYWVFIPPLKSKPDMDRIVSELKALGISEYAPLPESGRFRFAISLGVFRTEAGAKTRLASLHSKGVRSAQIGEREQRITQKSFLIRNANDAQLAQLASLKTEYPGSELRPVDCPSP